jgi:membrane protein implicated in regulation of membrane protease activity
MIDAPAFYGPPVIFVLGPWLLMVLLLAGPFALFLLVLLALAAAAGLIAVFVAMIASAYLLIRRLHSRRTARAKQRARRHRSRTDRIAAGRFGLPQPNSVP